MRSLPPFPRRTMISRRSKSTSFTRSCSASSNRKPDPYSNPATSRSTPRIRPNTDRTSARVSTHGIRRGRCARATIPIQPTGLSNTIRYKNKIAASA